ncbi:hypothetical protein [Desulfosarcina ovata]|uniref:RNA polymerase alpha subunit C-terminal domain-containing protein n=1 Tax=Desulfosarcina ovata subsp. ovata TaxID=2752305 RepID=A0A5K8A3M5_9BACT|nr:hypothetical protein [Desulfosarcina ovata]BBO87036.1 hypothetical protein DSCOOX_02160 [Desulfosarcina ovata subsp. ovata]
MNNSSLYDKKSIDEVAKILNLSKRLCNGIRKHFGESLSLYDLSQITWRDFYPCKGLGIKSWREFSDAISIIDIPKKAVKILDKPSSNKIIIEIDISKSFSKVIKELSDIMKASVYRDRE